MKKLLFTLALIFTLLISCEKWELIPVKLNGTFTSETFELANLDSVQLNLVVNEGIIQGAYVNHPFYIKVDLIVNNIFNHDDWIISIIYFNFGKTLKYEKLVSTYYGTLEIEESDSKNYEFIGYLNIKDPITHYNRWRYILYFR